MYLSLQGNIGLGKAIEYFTSHEIPISIPLNDTQKYDLIIDENGKLSRVSVKTSRYMNSQTSYTVLLKNCGGSSGKSKIRPFDNKSCDYVFILTGNDRMYLIPSNKILAKNAVTVGNKYTEFEVKNRKFSEFTNKNMP